MYRDQKVPGSYLRTLNCLFPSPALLLAEGLGSLLWASEKHAGNVHIQAHRTHLSTGIRSLLLAKSKLGKLHVTIKMVSLTLLYFTQVAVYWTF